MTRGNPLEPFKGWLTLAQAAEGIRVAVQNANALLEDAELLQKNGRWPRACALAILAIEEAGKPSIVRQMLLARDAKELRQEWRDYRRHLAKNAVWLFPQLVKEGARFLEDFRPLFDEESDHPVVLDSVKQIALYSDACGDCHWSLPSEVIGQQLAHSMVAIARILVPKSPGAMTTEAELELWVKHMGPIWKRSMAEMKRALLNCYAEAREKGVLDGDESTEEMARFLDF